jgi:uncharacterized spore protein YtfJ
MAVTDMLKSISDRMGAVATVNTVFGEPRVQDGRAIVPVAMVAGGFGAGGGEGKMPFAEGEKVQEGSGGGGGGGFMVRPLAVLEITPEKTRIIPILDMTRIILAGIGLLAGWIVIKARSKPKPHWH